MKKTLSNAVYLPVAYASFVVGVVTLANFLLFIKPVIGRHDHNNDLVANIQLKQHELDASNKKIISVTNTLEKVMNICETHSIELEPANSINSRISTIVQLAATNKVTLIEATPAEPTHEDAYQTIPIEFKGKGEYADVAGFINHLVVMYRDISVDGFSITMQPADQPVVIINMIWFAAAD